MNIGKFPRAIERSWIERELFNPSLHPCAVSSLRQGRAYKSFRQTQRAARSRISRE